MPRWQKTLTNLWVNDAVSKMSPTNSSKLSQQTGGRPVSIALPPGLADCGSSAADPEQIEKERVLRFFAARTVGYFVEVGANHPTGGSQSWPLEQLGWRGMLVEPLPELHSMLGGARPLSVAIQAACGSPSQRGRRHLHVPGDMTGFATLARNVDDPYVEYTRSVEVDVKTLDELLESQDVTQVDFVSIDTEGTELDVLRGFNLAKYRPSLLLIEDKLQDLSKVTYLASRGYRLARRTCLNNWFVPDDLRLTDSSMAERVRLFRKVYLGLPFRQFRRWRHHRKAKG
jgi:FkbM family methyltransferase